MQRTADPVNEADCEEQKENGGEGDEILKLALAGAIELANDRRVVFHENLGNGFAVPALQRAGKLDATLFLFAFDRSCSGFTRHDFDRVFGEKRHAADVFVDPELSDKETTLRGGFAETIARRMNGSAANLHPSLWNSNEKVAGAFLGCE